MNKITDFVLSKFLAFLKSGLGAKLLLRLLGKLFEKLTGKPLCDSGTDKNVLSK